MCSYISVISGYPSRDNNIKLNANIFADSYFGIIDAINNFIPITSLLIIYAETFSQLLKQLSDTVELNGLHTQRTIIKSVAMILLPEARALSTRQTLESLYEGLCASPRYHSHSDCIVCYIVVELLKLDIKDKHLQIDLQDRSILESRELKFVELLTTLSYESKESLVEAKILSESSKVSTEDTAEMISTLVQSGELVSTSVCLNKLLKSVSNGTYREQIKAVLDSPEWAITDNVPKENVLTRRNSPTASNTKVLGTPPDPVFISQPSLLGKLGIDHS